MRLWAEPYGANQRVRYHLAESAWACNRANSSEVSRWCSRSKINVKVVSSAFECVIRDFWYLLNVQFRCTPWRKRSDRISVSRKRTEQEEDAKQSSRSYRISNLLIIEGNFGSFLVFFHFKGRVKIWNGQVQTSLIFLNIISVHPFKASDLFPVETPSSSSHSSTSLPLMCPGKR